MGASNDETGGAPEAADATRTAPNLGEDPTLTGGTPVPAEVDATLDATLDDTSRGGLLGGPVGSLTPEHPGRYGGGPDPRDGVRVLGQGGMGRVLRGYDRHLGREVAIKELLGVATHGPHVSPRTSPTLARFVREARITAQLEHPSIVPVHELGVRPDGTLYYTMKRVRGRTLEDALAAAGGLDGRLGLVGHVLDLCHAIAYAHARGVIHRDIKPANVMVGEFGETIVLDWGLARLRGGPDADTRDRPDRLVRLPDDDGSDPGRTVAGAAFGTPSTMSPEQARGDVEAVDERSDVWSLGAVLFHLLTGRPPFIGATARDIIVQARDATPPPVRSLEPSAPPELAAIAEQALRRSPGERYPSAQAMARDLEAWTAGRRVGAHSYTSWELLRRFVDRHRVPVIVTTLAVVLLLVAGIGAHLRVLEARDRAAEQRDAAREFASYLVNDVSESIASLAGGGALRKELLARALAYYEDPINAEDLSADEKRTMAVGTLRIAELAHEGGEAEVTERAVAGAERLLRSLLRAAPDDPDAILDMALWCELRARVDEDQGRYDAARRGYREAEELAGSVLRRTPGEVKAQRASARAAYYLGLLALSHGPTDEAGPLLLRSADLEMEILKAHPEDELAAANAINSHHAVAKLALVRNGTADAVAALERAIAVGDERLRVTPHDVNTQLSLIEVRDELAAIALTQGEVERAVTLSREALAAAQRLREQDPWSTLRQRMVCAMQLRAALALEAHGDPEEALRLAQSALETHELLLLKEPTSAVGRRDAAVALHRVAMLVDAAGRAEEARSLYERALVLHDELVAEEPNNAERIRDRSVALEQLADVDWSLGRREEAEAGYREVLALREGLLERDPGNRDLARTVAVTLGNLAAAVRQQGRLQEALAIAERSVAARRAAVAADPPSVSARTLLGRGLEEVSLIHHGLGDYRRSLDAIEEALGISDALMREAEPAQQGRRRELLPPYAQAIALATWLREPDRARALAERARGVAEELLDRTPDDVLVLTAFQSAAQLLGDYDAYLGTVRHLRELEPDDGAHAVELLEALVLAGRYGEVAAAREEALGGLPACQGLDTVGLAYLAIAAALAGDGPAAAREAREAQRALADCPTVPVTWSWAGVAQALAGRGKAGEAAAALVGSLECNNQPGCDTVLEAFERFARTVAPSP